jgi:putative hydrolase of the HAD superfamily
MRYSVVLLDVGETLVGPSGSFGAIYARVLEQMGRDSSGDLLERCLREVWAEQDRIVPPGSDRYAHYPGGEREYWFRFARNTLERAFGEPVEEAFVLEVLERLRVAFRDRDAWKVYPDVVPALQGLREDGVRLGVVSNWDSRLPTLLEELGLTEYFEALGVSHLEGVEKPDPDLFRRVLQRLGAAPEEALHVGDVPALDLAGAKAAGVDAVLVDRKGTLDRAYPALADLVDLPSIARGRRDTWPVILADRG